MSKKQKMAHRGVAEDASPFFAEADDWTIARERLAEYRRTGETISVEEFMEELDRQVAIERAKRT